MGSERYDDLQLLKHRSTRMEYTCDHFLYRTHKNLASENPTCWLCESKTHVKEVSNACVGACAACVTVDVLNVDPTVVSRHKVCHHPVTMAPNLAETRRRQGAPCHRGNKSGM